MHKHLMKKLSAAFGLALGVTFGAQAAVTPIDVTGYTDDMVLNNPTPHDTTVTSTMDNGIGNFENWTWVEAGSYVNPDGNPQTISGIVAGVHASLTGSGTFEIQPAAGLNVLGLDSPAKGGGPIRTSGTLTLVAPGQFTTIALYGAAGYGGNTADVTLNFADATTTTFNITDGIVTDWFNTSAQNAFAVGARASNKIEEGYTRLFIQESSDIHLHETLLTLTPTDAAKTLNSITIENTSTNGNTLMSVFAVSGEVIPEPSSMAMVAVGGLLLTLRHQRKA